MNMLSQTLARLRLHAIELDALTQQVRLEAPELVGFANRLARTSRDFAEDVETLHILSLAVPSNGQASQPLPVEPAPVNPANDGQDVAEAAEGALSGADLFLMSKAAHDRDFAQGRDGIPPHRAGERPADCSACAVFDALWQPEPSIVS